MPIVVQKYGGSSLADAESIKRVARRIAETRKAGNDVVVAVSAMGDSTDDLLDLAQEVSPVPPPRELDMLMTAGERISMALVAMAISDLGYSARSFTGSQAGVITDGVHGKAKIIDVTPGRITEALAKGHIVIVAGFQLGWAPYVSDYSRYLPASVGVRSTFWWTYLPSAVSGLWVFALGSIMYAAAGPDATPVEAFRSAADSLINGFGWVAVP